MDDQPANPDEPVRIPVTDIFDLHTIAPRYIEAVVEEYLEEAALGFMRCESFTDVV